METNLSACGSQDPATRFDLQTEFMPLVEEAKKLYNIAMSGSDWLLYDILTLSKVTSRSLAVLAHGGVFQKRFCAGQLHDTVIIPIVNEDNAQVTAWNESGNKANIIWQLTNYIFTRRLTYLDIEAGKKVGSIVVYFRRK